MTASGARWAGDGDTPLDELEQRLDHLETARVRSEVRRIHAACLGCAAVVSALLALPWGRAIHEVVGSVSGYVTTPAAPAVALAALLASGIGWWWPRFWPASIGTVALAVAGLVICVLPWFGEHEGIDPGPAAWFAPPAFGVLLVVALLTLPAQRRASRPRRNGANGVEQDPVRRLRGEWLSRSTSSEGRTG